MWSDGSQCDCDECGGRTRGDDGRHQYTSEIDSSNSSTQLTTRSNCALLSIVFSDVLIFHITNNDFLHSIRFIIPIFKLAIHLSSKEAPGRYVTIFLSVACSSPHATLGISIGQTLLLFIITPSSLGMPILNAQGGFSAVVERTWAAQLSETTESADRRLYDYFDISFMAVSPELSGSEWAKVDVMKPKARFFNKNRADYVFQPRYKKKFATDELGLCMSHLWVRWYHDFHKVVHLWAFS